MSELSGANAEQARYWTERAPEWMEFEDLFGRVGGPAGALAMDRLTVSPGAQVLDIGCGTGVTTLELAGRVAPGGGALGVDISAPLLDEARRRAGDRADVEFLLADAQVDELGESRFDAAYSRFGVMFFEDPVRAFANIRRSLVPGAHLSFASWQPPFVNEWVLVPAMAAISVLGVMPEMPGPDAPGPFGLADPEKARRVLHDAGFTDVDVSAHADQVVFEEAQVPALALTSTRTGAVRELLGHVGEERRPEVAEAIEAALRERLADGGVSLGRAVLLVTARA